MFGTAMNIGKTYFTRLDALLWRGAMRSAALATADSTLRSYSGRVLTAGAGLAHRTGMGIGAGMTATGFGRAGAFVSARPMAAGTLGLGGAVLGARSLVDSLWD